MTALFAEDVPTISRIDAAELVPTPTFPVLSCMMMQKMTLSSTPIFAAAFTAFQMKPMSWPVFPVWNISDLLLLKIVVKSAHELIGGKFEAGPEYDVKPILTAFLTVLELEEVLSWKCTGKW